MGLDEKRRPGILHQICTKGFWIGMSREENRTREAGVWHTTRACVILSLGVPTHRLHGNCQLVLGCCLDRKIHARNREKERAARLPEPAALKRCCALGRLSCCR